MAQNKADDVAGGIPFPPGLLEPEEDGAGISPFAVLNVFLRHLRVVIGLPVLAFVIAALATLGGEKPFVATSRFMPTDPDRIGGRSGGIVSELSRLVGGSSDGASPNFYAALVQSPALLRDAAQSEYEFMRRGEDGEPADTVRGTLAEIYGLRPATEERNVRASQGILRGAVTAIVEPGAGFVGVITSARWPGLAVAINRRILELVNEFNIEQRQTQAAAERRFIEERMEVARRDLEAAEDELQRFLERNQMYSASSRLRFEAERLERRVDLQQQVYVSLATSYEQTRISEVRNTPVMTVVQWPEETVARDRGQPVYYNGFFAFLVTALVVAGVVFARAYFSRQSEEHPEEYAEFRELARDSVPALLQGTVRERLAAIRRNGERTGRARGSVVGDPAGRARDAEREYQPAGDVDPADRS